MEKQERPTEEPRCLGSTEAPCSVDRLKVLDLFSGIGGFSLGLERAGMETVAFCEIDKTCHAVLRKHWPGTPIFEDVRTLNGIKADVICGGFPCQDVSIANSKGKGITGERSGLWKEYLRLIGEIKPSYVIAENVANLRSRGLSTVLHDLWQVGYDAEWHIIPASGIGALHKRERCWIVAYPRCEHGEERPEITPRLQRQLKEWNTCSKFKRSSEAQIGINESASDVCGMADDVPTNVDRLRWLGNSVVPKIPELIGRAILAQAA